MFGLNAKELHSLKTQVGKYKADKAKLVEEIAMLDMQIRIKRTEVEQLETLCDRIRKGEYRG